MSDNPVSWRIFHQNPIGFEINALVTMTGHETQTVKNNYHWNGLKRGDACVIIWQRTIAGCGVLRCGKQHFKIKPGKAMLIAIPQDHEYEVDPETGFWEFDFIIMRGAEIFRIGQEIIRSHGPLLDYTEMTDSWKCAETILKEEESDTNRLSILAYEFIMLLGKDFHKEGPSRFEVISDTLLNARQLALKYFSKPITVQELADASNMNYAHFIRAFTRAFHVSPGTFLNDLQMEMAVGLLERSNLAIKEIAKLCGFSSVQYFYRSFRRHFQKTPQEFRDGISGSLNM